MRRALRIGSARPWLVNALRERRVLISCTGPHAHTLKIRPPLVFSEAHVDQFLDALESAMAAMD